MIKNIFWTKKENQNVSLKIFLYIFWSFCVFVFVCFPSPFKRDLWTGLLSQLYKDTHKNHSKYLSLLFSLLFVRTSLSLAVLVLHSLAQRPHSKLSLSLSLSLTHSLMSFVFVSFLLSDWVLAAPFFLWHSTAARPRTHMVSQDKTNWLFSFPKQTKIKFKTNFPLTIEIFSLNLNQTKIKFKSDKQQGSLVFYWLRYKKYLWIMLIFFTS